MEKLNARMELKLSQATMDALLEIEKTHHLSPAVVCRALADAAAEYFTKNKRFGFPVTLSEGPATPISPVTIDAAPKKGNVSLTRKRDKAVRDMGMRGQVTWKPPGVAPHVDAMRAGKKGPRSKAFKASGKEHAA